MSTEQSRSRWHRSTYSGENAHCVEVASASAGDTRLVRDSKLGENSPILEVSPSTFTAFLGAVRAR